MQPQKGYIPSLDGIRACAVAVVMIAHLGYDDIVPGGFGVTVFFFLSGYLITTLLRLEWEKTGTISLKNFYIRRMYRIFPPLYVVLATIGLLVATGLLEMGRPFQLAPVLAQVFFGTNYYGIIVGFEDFLPGTAVFWSLAVEEHFYLFFPLVFLGMLRRGSYQRIASILLVTCFVTLVWRVLLIYVFDVDESYTYMATDTRIESLMWGCVLAVFYNPHLDSKRLIRSRGGEVGLMIAAVAILLVCFVYRDPGFRETFRYTLQGAALFPLFWLAVRYPQWMVFRPLNWEGVRWIGRISYTLYLIHFAAYGLANKVVDAPLQQQFLGVALSIAFAGSMYVLVEKPLMSFRKKYKPMPSAS